MTIHKLFCSHSSDSCRWMRYFGMLDLLWGLFLKLFCIIILLFRIISFCSWCWQDQNGVGSCLGFTRSFLGTSFRLSLYFFWENSIMREHHKGYLGIFLFLGFICTNPRLFPQNIQQLPLRNPVHQKDDQN